MSFRKFVGAAAFLVSAMGLSRAAESSIDARDWPWVGGTRYGEHFSSLQQINRSNVSRLGLAFSFEEFVVRGRTHRGNEASALMVEGVLYFSGPWSVVYAVDATNGRRLWSYDPHVPGAWARVACCDVVNRGVAISKGIVYAASLDGFLIALDARTGRELWQADTFVDRVKMNYTSTGAPRIAGSNVVIGNAGAEMGARGYVSAYDLKTGRLAWRFYTVPGDTATGPDESPDITLARKTWSAHSRWDLGGGGTVWDSMVYDAKLNLLYVRVGNGCPHPAWIRSPGGGDNLFLSSIVALDASSGRMKWYYQTTPGDSWDYTATQNLILADLPVRGRLRAVIMQAPKNGFFYVLDRSSGELVSAKNFTTVTWASAVDAKTGRPQVSPQSDFSQQPKLIWPSQVGGHNWMPMSYSVDTHLVYIPVTEAPEVFSTWARSSERFRHGTVNEGDWAEFVDADADQALLRGQPAPRLENRLIAWNPLTQTIAWKSASLPFLSGGILSTAGGLVFEGNSDGRFIAYDAQSGQVARQIETGSAIMAAPISYEIGGTQYIAVLAGFGGASLGAFPPGSAPLRYENQERLLVFKVDGGSIPKPPLKQSAPQYPLPQPISSDQKEVARGEYLFKDHCDTPSGYPDLWNLPSTTHEVFDAIVFQGPLEPVGMASFKDLLTLEDVHAIHAYLISDAASTRGRHPIEEHAERAN